eukprot:scaffold179_cov368-Prasinococcus_capsulatus_cf.AAC.6
MGARNNPQTTVTRSAVCKSHPCGKNLVFWLHVDVEGVLVPAGECALTRLLDEDVGAPTEHILSTKGGLDRREQLRIAHDLIVEERNQEMRLETPLSQYALATLPRARVPIGCGDVGVGLCRGLSGR